MQCAITKSEGDYPTITVKVTSSDGLSVDFELPSKLFKTNATNLATGVANGFETPYELTWNTWDGYSGLVLSKTLYTHESTACGDCDTAEGGSFECPMNASVVQAFGDFLKLVEVVDDPPVKKRNKRAKMPNVGVQSATIIHNTF